MKKGFLLFTVALLIGLSSVVQAKTSAKGSLADAIRMYKAKNYSQCYVLLDNIVKKDPSNALAHYYLAMTYAQIGRSTDAVNSYQKVIDLVPDGKLNLYAKKGKICIESPENCHETVEINVLDEFIRGRFGSGFSDEARGEYEKQKIENLMREMNRNGDIEPNKFEGYKDFSTQVPTNEEIVNAIKILQKSGLINLLSNNDYNSMDLSLLHNVGSNNFDTIQMLMGGRDNGSNLSPQVIQSLITGQLSTGF